MTSTRCNQVFERFRVKNDLLVSQIDEMDWVEHDRSISTGDEDDYDADYKDDYDADYKDDENGETVEGLGAMSDDNLEDLDEEIEDEFEKEFVQYVFCFFSSVYSYSYQYTYFFIQKRSHY